MNVPRGTIFESYLNLLLKWQSKVNLISPATVSVAWERHFEDSLTLVPYIDDKAECIIDLGSGAGFPGLVVCISTNIPTILIESDRKKCLFLKEVIRTTNANATVHKRKD